jgi:Carboxypeptidase regulatory-like domain/TonB-dependent Receptor Plug Domain
MARFLLICTLLLAGMTAYAQTSLSGKVTDEKGEPLFAANIVLLRNGGVVSGAETDFDGNYSLSGLDPGTYDIRCTYTGMSESVIKAFTVKSGKANVLDFPMQSSATIGEVIVKTYKIPPINPDNTSGGAILDSKQVAAMPTKNLESMVAASAGVGQSDEGKGITIRGSREDGQVYMVDGVRVSSSSLPPAQDVEQLEIITGGLAAIYGDASGGIISVTTKSGSSKFAGGLEVESSQFLDAYGYNLVAANLSGPIKKTKSGDPLISFRVSGQYRQRKDDNPSAIGITKVKDDVLKDLQANPVQVNGTNAPVFAGAPRLPNIQSRARFLTADQLENVKANPNTADRRYEFNGKLDFKLSKQVDFVLGGNYWNESAKVQDNDRNLLNYDRNGNSAANNYRAWGRIRHRLDGESKDKKEVSTLQNVYYTILGSYTSRNDKFNDVIHGDNVFNYGYIGNFDIRDIPSVNNGVQGPYRSTLYGYTVNPNYTGNSTLIAANQPYADLLEQGQSNLFLNMNDFMAYNGGVSGEMTSVYFNPATTNTGQGIVSMGMVYNTVQKRQRNSAEVRLDGSFDLLPTHSKTNVHSVQMGILYEQRDEHLWSMSPRALWQVANQSMNNQLRNGLDSSAIKYVNDEGVRIYQPRYIKADQTQFDINVRSLLGYAADSREFINVNSLNPSQLSLGMFSADELLANRGGTTGAALSYYGYDYQGNTLPSNTTFGDFFTAKDARGNFTRPITAFAPSYAAGYIQDKFKLEKIIFRVGLRLDRYDASTKVLRDPFNLYDGYALKAKQFATDYGYKHPANIGDNFAVYGNKEAVTAYRNGEQWYNAAGTPVNDVTTIVKNTGDIRPAFASKEIDIKDPKFVVDNTFKDYTPQVIVSPRLSFSFPISDKAGFFAHYDVLVQRPSSNSIATALNYYYFEEATNGQLAFPNANLQPQRTIDYEVGFQQMVSTTAAIKVQAYYKELRDLIQERRYAQAYPKAYTSYSNIDFGTVKGLTFSFDQRRIGNLQFGLAYTLQFADGTGSSATSSRSLPDGTINRSIFPLSYDERHKVVVTADYHFLSGKDYNGPELFGYRIFENAGINILTSFTSGRPYTQSKTPQQWEGNVKVGSLSGSRLPWNNVVNLRIDKDFKLSKNPKSPLALNVYFRVQNLLDTRNILNVYTVTGAVDNDGFLATANGQGQVQSGSAGGSAASYTLLYNTIMLNPDYFSLPRRMFVGAQFSF